MMTRTDRHRIRWLPLVLVPALLWLCTVHPSAGAAPPGEGGIGGTGITGYGVVQRFGSIFVNGREYFLDRATRYREDGRLGTAADLHLGEVVLVQAQANAAGRVTARSVRIEVALAGRIERIDAHTSSFMLLGQTVRVMPETRLAVPGLALKALHIGESVQVSALSDGAGRWVATRLAPASATGFALRGTVRALDTAHGRITIGTRTLKTAPAELAGLVVGERVRIAGRYVRGIPVVVRARPIVSPVGAPGTVVEMSGYVQGEPTPGHVLVNGVRLRNTAQTRFSGGTAADIRPGTLIAVRGITEPDGSVRVDRVVLGADPVRVDLLPIRTLRPGAGEGRALPERPEIERPHIERPDIEPPGPPGG